MATATVNIQNAPPKLRRSLSEQAAELRIELPSDVSRQRRWQIIREARAGHTFRKRRPCKRKPKRPSGRTRSADNTLTIRLRRPLRESLVEMAQFTLNVNGWRPVSHHDLAGYAQGLIEIAIVDWREKNYAANLRKKDTTPNILATDYRGRKSRSKLSDNNRAEIREQRDGGMGITELAERWGVGTSTIRRVLFDE